MTPRLSPSLVLAGALLALAGCASGPVVREPARDAFVLLSGGGTPLSNNYSQYLQAKAFATYFQRRYADRPHWVFFGVGNREGEVPILADVRRQVRRDGRPCVTTVPPRAPASLAPSGTRSFPWSGAGGRFTCS